jgi:hypothetical protein
MGSGSQKTIVNHEPDREGLGTGESRWNFNLVWLCHGSLVVFVCHTPQGISSNLLTFCNVEERFISNYFQICTRFHRHLFILHYNNI